MSVFRIFLPHIWSNDAPWPSIRTRLGRLRLAGFVEGTTLLVLLLIAVPLKYGLDMPEFVSTMGPIHGLAFVFYFTQAAATVFFRRLDRHRDHPDAVPQSCPLWDFYE